MRKVRILGEELNICFNFAVELKFEELTNDSFDIRKLNGNKKLSSLYWAAITVNNENVNFSFDEFTKNAKKEEIDSLDEAIAVEFKKWMNIPDTLGADITDKPSEKGEEEKNV